MYTQVHPADPCMCIACIHTQVVNATFSAGPPPAASDAFAGWDDEFARLLGPEVITLIS